MNKKIEIIKESDKADLITHSGNFHADEVFATVVLSKLIDKENITLCRISAITQNEKGIVYDIGYGEYDHHQPGGNGERLNGVKYAAFGLIWKAFGKEYLKSINATNIDEYTRYELLQRLEGMKNHAKLCHGDFNPSNVIITEDGTVQ